LVTISRGGFIYVGGNTRVTLDDITVSDGFVSAKEGGFAFVADGGRFTGSWLRISSHAEQRGLCVSNLLFTVGLILPCSLNV
jgi:hypothetical protein